MPVERISTSSPFASTIGVLRQVIHSRVAVARHVLVLVVLVALGMAQEVVDHRDQIAPRRLSVSGTISSSTERPTSSSSV